MQTKTGNKRVRVIGGVRSGDEGKGKGVFVRKREVVIEEKYLGALFKRDWELCEMPIINLENTNDRLTPGYCFSER